MTPQLTASLIMFAITIIVASAFCWPMTRFPRKSKLVNFYWAGFWSFLAIISAVAGAQSTLLILGQDVSRFASAILGALVITFVLFVVFAWARLVLKGAQHLVTKKPA